MLAESRRELVASCSSRRGARVAELPAGWPAPGQDPSALLGHQAQGECGSLSRWSSDPGPQVKNTVGSRALLTVRRKHGFSLEKQRVPCFGADRMSQLGFM